ncbi:MAG: type V CRISPR-associated endonuclease Cas1 [Eubacteriales bacterium]|nr:type V CRISPR-associated endonuclease Cas1 [Eubacteriales bacterium]
MLDRTDFEKKQIIFFFPTEGDKMSFRNDNLLISDKEGKIKAQTTCYRIFLIFVVGDTTITTGLLNRSSKFGFSICFMNRNMKLYKFIGSRMEGNTLLRKNQYSYDGKYLAQRIIWNKIRNQRKALAATRQNSEWFYEAMAKMDGYLSQLENGEFERDSLLGIEGAASRLYFSRMFSNVNWKGRKPRIKADYVNASLDVGYTILFNIIDSLINVYVFDEYKGVLHTCFYMRKSLVCDLVEPFRPIIDYTTRKAINLGQFKPDDFKEHNKKYLLEWKNSKKYTYIYLSEIMKRKNEIFLCIQGYYRAFMKNKHPVDFPIFEY